MDLPAGPAVDSVEVCVHGKRLSLSEIEKRGNARVGPIAEPLLGMARPRSIGNPSQNGGLALPPGNPYACARLGAASISLLVRYNPGMAGRRGRNVERTIHNNDEKQSSVELLRSPVLDQIPWLAHGFSTRRGGVSEVYGGGALNLSLTQDDTAKAVERNRGLLMGSLPQRPPGKTWELFTVRQVHSAVIWQIDQSDSVESPRTGDGLITGQPGVLVGIKTADCIPVILVDVRRRVVGAFHAGWRGTAARIVEKGVGEMQRRFGTNPKDIRAAVGPGIHSCCYEVGEELRSAFQSQFDYADALFTESASGDEIHRKYPLLFMNMRAPGHGEEPSKLHLDLPEANRRQLLAAGIAERAISVSDLCTACRTDLLFSHRAERGRTGRMLAVAGIRE
jgi:YfiH family protein